MHQEWIHWDMRDQSGFGGVAGRPLVYEDRLCGWARGPGSQASESRVEASPGLCDSTSFWISLEIFL